MDPAYLHISINHIPIILAVLGAAAAIASVVWPRRALWLYAVATLTLAGLSAYPTVATGHGAAASLRPMWYVPPGAVGAHAAAAGRAMWTLLAAGALAAYAWWRALRHRTPGAVADAPRGEAHPPAWLRALVAAGGVAATATVVIAAKRSDPILHYSSRLAHPPAPGIPATAPTTGVGAATPPTTASRATAPNGTGSAER